MTNAASFPAMASAQALAMALLFLLGSGVLSSQEGLEPTYAGDETCAACHDEVAKAFERNRHAVVNQTPRFGWQTRACESCHGPGSAHAESGGEARLIRQPAKIAPAEADRTCLGCHANTSTHVGRVFGPHARNEVACVACHKVHEVRRAEAAGRAARINTQCAGCHTSERVAFERPHSHPLKTAGGGGAMSCVDCHNPHGSRLAATVQLTRSGEPGCLNCHGDKRGPFLYEHAPVRLEGCQRCHEPHGSTNPRMLTRPTVQQVCLECHANIGSGAAAGNALGGIPPALHDLRLARFRNCTNCHIKIHGSHVNRGLLR